MASAQASTLDVVRKAISSWRPDRPTLAAYFTEEDLHKLYEAGCRTADAFSRASRATLLGLGLSSLQADGLTTAHPLDIIREALTSLRPDYPNFAADFTDEELWKLYDAGYTTRNALLRAEWEALYNLGLRPEMVESIWAGRKQATAEATTIAETIVKGIMDAPWLQELLAKAPKSQICYESPLWPKTQTLPLPSPEQWRAFFYEMNIPEQPDYSDWVELLYHLELAARKKHKVTDGIDYASSAPPSTFKDGLGEKEKVHLAVGYIIRALEAVGMTKLYWRDTSCHGLQDGCHQPDFAGLVNHMERYISVGAMIQVKDTPEDNMLGQIAERAEHQFATQPLRQRALAVAIGRESVDIVVAAKSESGSMSYSYGQFGLNLNRESEGLQHLVAVITAPAEASGYVPMPPPEINSEKFEFVGPSVPLRY